MKRNDKNTSLLRKGLFVFCCALAISCSSDSPVEETGGEPETPTTPEEEPEEPVAAKVYTVDNITDTYYDVAGVENVAN
ncbi:MAG: arabinan endo-1,5-alpha-L-arabinosidase, partial [Bacteroidota bacterium]|nr:arabinan endo-1,5-alpha-L-arabinosidase [Bacteroidota bacterium]